MLQNICFTDIMDIIRTDIIYYGYKNIIDIIFINIIYYIIHT